MAAKIEMPWLGKCDDCGKPDANLVFDGEYRRCDNCEDAKSERFVTSVVFIVQVLMSVAIIGVVLFIGCR